jgi:hypothetical protein
VCRVKLVGGAQDLTDAAHLRRPLKGYSARHDAAAKGCRQVQPRVRPRLIFWPSEKTR